MSVLKYCWVGIYVFLLTLLILFSTAKSKNNPQAEREQVISQVESQIPQKPITYNISNVIPNKYLSFQEVDYQLRKWQTEAPGITIYGVAGIDRDGTNIPYLKIGKLSKDSFLNPKPKILIHAAIHGNERLSTACTLGIMGLMLKNYGIDEEVTWIINNRDIYFVPVVSPRTYLISRHVDGGDPNRNWPYPGSRTSNQSGPVQALQRFFEREKFVAVIDGHTTGRDFFWPSIVTPEDEVSISKLAKEMALLADYNPESIGPITKGYAIDWYYWNGAVAILTEFGSSQIGHNQPVSSIEPETMRTYKSYLHFMRHAPEIKLNSPKTTSRLINPSQRINECPELPSHHYYQPTQQTIIRQYYYPIRQHRRSCCPY